MYENICFSEKEVVSLTGSTRREVVYLKSRFIVTPVIKKPIRYTYNQLILLKIIKLLKRYLSIQFIGEVIEDNFVFECDLSTISLMVISGNSIILVDDSEEIQNLCDEILLPLNEEIFEEAVKKGSKINSIFSNVSLISSKRLLILSVYRIRNNLRAKAEELDIYNYQKREQLADTLIPKNIA